MFVNVHQYENFNVNLCLHFMFKKIFFKFIFFILSSTVDIWLYVFLYIVISIKDYGLRVK